MNWTKAGLNAILKWDCVEIAHHGADGRKPTRIEMEMPLPQNMAPETLKRLVRRYNRGCVLLGSVLLGAALLIWIATFHLIMVCVVLIRSDCSFPDAFASPWVHLDHGSCAMIVIAVVIVVWIGFFHTELFFRVETDSELHALRNVSTLYLLSPSGWTLLLAIPCLAPILTWQAVAAFRSRLSLRGARLRLAVLLYQYLDDWGDWVPYPKFESQRQAVILLALLGLVRVSRRFGKHQVKLVGGRPRWKRRIAGD